MVLIVIALLLGACYIGYQTSRYYWEWRQANIMGHHRLFATGYIYFVRQTQGRQNLVKIGRSNDPIRRIRALRTSVPGGLHVMGILPTMDDVASEKMIHQRFKDLRLSPRQEWFRLTVPLQLYIDSVSDKQTTTLVRKAVRLHD